MLAFPISGCCPRPCKQPSKVTGDHPGNTQLVVIFTGPVSNINSSTFTVTKNDVPLRGYASFNSTTFVATFTLSTPSLGPPSPGVYRGSILGAKDSKGCTIPEIEFAFIII